MHPSRLDSLSRPTGRGRGLWGVPRDRWALGPPAAVPDLRARRLLRQLDRQTRDRPPPGDRPPDHPLGRARRGLELVLPGWT